MKKRSLLVLLLIVSFSCFKTYGQTTLDSVNVYKPEKYPEYKNGLQGWVTFLSRNLDRDVPVKAGAPSGKYTVIASFMVDSVGRVSDIIIEHDAGYGTGKEVKRVIQFTDKRWNPAIDNGRAVSFRHRQSITFVVN